MLATMHKTWLEVALNGPWGKTRQPGIPVRVAIERAGGKLASAADVRAALS